MLKDREEFFRLFQADLPLAGLAGPAFDPLVHGVHDRTGEVRLRIRQALRIVRASSLGQRKVALCLQVGEQHRPLPWRARLNEELGEHGGERKVLNHHAVSPL